jgi:hypothetical protein
MPRVAFFVFLRTRTAREFRIYTAQNPLTV